MVLQTIDVLDSRRGLTTPFKLELIVEICLLLRLLNMFRVLL